MLLEYVMYQVAPFDVCLLTIVGDDAEDGPAYYLRRLWLCRTCDGVAVTPLYLYR